MTPSFMVIAAAQAIAAYERLLNTNDIKRLDTMFISKIIFVQHHMVCELIATVLGCTVCRLTLALS